MSLWGRKLSTILASHPPHKIETFSCAYTNVYYTESENIYITRI